MKYAKKLAGLLLALVMVFALATTALADETTYSITINNSTAGHTYEAYQIFTGDLATNEAGDKVLSNIVWGSSVSNSSDLGDAAAVAEKLDTSYTGEDKITLDDLLEMITLGNPVANSGETSNPYVISGLAAGYYLVKDKDGSLTDKGDAYTEYIIKVVDDVTAAPKSSVPKVEKKVKDTNDSTGVTSNWQDSADHDIDDSVPFQLTATLANNVSAYTTYKVVFHDTLSKGLTYNSDAVVKIDNVDKTTSFTITTGTDENGNPTLTISCDDVKALGAGNSSVITVEYTAILNDNAVLGSVGNPNEVYLTYSNNPNKSEEGDNETGTTPEDKVIVFTYKTIINKVDGEGEPLTGAAFKLEKLIKGVDGAEDTWVLVKEFTIDEEHPASSFEFTGLDDGTYKLTETVTPASYNTIDPIEFTVTAEHDILSDNPALTSLSGNATTGELTFTSNTADGSLSADVINKAGSTLPSTGGMGTTIFYVLGGVLVLAAVVLLVTRKRMSAEK